MNHMSETMPCTHGERASSLTTESFILTRANYAALSRAGWHEHERPGLTFVLDGDMRESFARRTLECGKDALIAKPPDARHRNAYGKRGADCLIIEVQWERVSSIGEETDILDRIAVWQGGGRAAIVRRLARELRECGTAIGLLAEALVLELFASAARSRDGQPPWLRRAQELMHSEFRCIRRVSEVAVVAGVHPVHLARVFRAQFGCSVADYLRRLRLEWAATAIAEGEQSILDVALESGYADQSHFTRAFAGHFGVPPARYRKLHARLL